jgi:hypothetical protein
LTDCGRDGHAVAEAAFVTHSEPPIASTNAASIQTPAEPMNGHGPCVDSFLAPAASDPEGFMSAAAHGGAAIVSGTALLTPPPPRPAFGAPAGNAGRVSALVLRSTVLRL